MSLTSIACTITLLPHSGPPQGAPHDDPGPGGKRLAIVNFAAYAQYFKRPILRGLLAQFFFYMLGFSTFTSGFALFAERRFTWEGHPFTPREIGFLLGYVGFLGIILQGGLIGRLVKRFGEASLVSSGFVSLIIGYLILGPIRDVGLLILVSTVSSFGNGVLRPTLSSLVSQNAGRHEQGVVLGLNQSLNSAAQIMAPVVGGILIGQGMLTVWARVASAAALIGLFVGHGGRRWCPKRAPSNKARASLPFATSKASRFHSPTILAKIRRAYANGSVQT